MKIRVCPVCGAVVESPHGICATDGAMLQHLERPFDADATPWLAQRYQVTHRIGGSPSASLFVATDHGRGEAVLATVFHPIIEEDGEHFARFGREIRDAKRIVHPGVPRTLDYGRTNDGRYFVVTEYASGESLRTMLHRDGPLAPADAMCIAGQAAEVLRVAHELGVVHYGLTPDHLWITASDTGRLVVRVLGFGTTRTVVQGDVRTTLRGTLVGVPGYISPERADVARASGAGDQYALACILFEMLTGALPFEGTTMDLQIAARIAGDLRRLADVRPERQWPVTLQEAFRQALAPSAVDRFPSVVGFVDAAAFALGVLELMHSPDQVEEFPEGMTSLTARLQRPAPTSVPPDATVRDLDATDAPVSALRAVSVLVLGGLAMVLSAGLWIRAAAARP